ncbi:hypothetical protein ACIBKY_50900 [Nonomuraea sp. NPDC050394]|uniref:hypothetical protein n=1 Tax=Nonomuraea sp. NPDC050394 TaxID=3364363 RepID=UPI0037923C24
MAINVGELFISIDLRDRQFIRALTQATTSSRLAAIGFDRDARSIGASARATAGQLLQFGVGIVAAAARVAVLGAAAAGVGNALLSLGAALAPALGAVAAMPGLLALAAVGAGTLAVALYGVSDAFSAALGDDAAKFEEAVARLSPAAQAVARELRVLKPLLDGIRVTVQEALFAPLAGQLSMLAAVLAGPVTSGMAGVADAIGRSVSRVAAFGRSQVAVSTLAVVFGSLRAAIDAAAVAIDPLLAGLARIAAVGAQFSAGLVPQIAAAAARFGDFLTAAAESGRALAWMQGAVTVLRQLATAAVDLWGIASGVFAAMRAAGGDALGVLGLILDRINAWVNSAGGQRTLTAMFVAMGDAASALAPVLVAVAEGVGVLAPLIGALAVQVGPILTTAVQGLVPALAALYPGISAIFEGVRRAVEVAAPALHLLGGAVSAIFVAAAPLLPVLGQVAALIAGAIAAGVQAALPSLQLLVVSFGQALLALQPVIPLLASLGVTVVNQLVPALAPLLPQLALLIAHLVTGLVPILGPVIVLVGQVAGQIGQALLVGLRDAAPHLLSMVKSFADLLPVILPVLPPLVQLTTSLLPPLIQLLDGAARLLRGDLPGAIAVAARGIGEFLLIVGQLGVQLLQGLWNGIASAAGWFRDTLYTFFSSIMPDWVRQALGIRSPSTLFAAIGANTMLGMRDGMLGQTRAVLTAARSIAGQLGRAFTPELSANLATTGRTVTGGGSRTGGAVTVHVTAINPVAEPTSDTVNRGLAYAGMLGVL